MNGLLRSDPSTPYSVRHQPKPFCVTRQTDVDSALDDLEQSVPDLFLLYLRDWHVFDSLRSNPRFDSILQQMNLYNEQI